MAVKSIQMYRRQLDGTETDLNPLTESQYVLMENGQTVQEVLSDRDSDKYTPVITNSSSTFKVGQGDNVDLSSSMKEGAYDSCVLKGKTMVNCIQESSSRDIVLPYEFADGRYVTINDTKESGALGVELKGQTLVNTLIYEHTSLLSGATRNGDTITLNKSQQWSRIHLLPSNSLWIPNETYTTILYDVVGDTSTLHMCSQNGGVATKTPFTNNKAVFTMGRGRDTDNDNRLGYIESTTIVENETVSFKAIILKGDYSDVDVPYFTGMASCKMPTLHTVGKNLFDGELEDGSLNENTGDVESNPNFRRTVNFIRINPNKEYRLRANGTVNGRVYFYDINKAYISTQLNESRLVVPSNAKYLKFRIGIDVLNYGQEIQLEEGSAPTSYETHKSSILSLPEEVVLRSLPNGVCDTFNTRTGEYVQRIGEAIVNGSENWQLNNTEGTTTQRFFCSMLANSAVDNNTKGTQQYLCDRLRTITWSQTCELGLTINGSGVFVYNNSIEYTVGSVKQWLSQNPVKLQYELATPIITKINLLSTLKSWNTTTHIYSEIPENTLYPTLSHSNPSYPVILKPSTKYSIVANSYSNSHTNSAINFNLGGTTASTVVGNRVTTITTPSTLSNELLTMSGRGNKLNNVMVIEGDVVGDEPYFEGICDCKSPILSNIGKNLFDLNQALDVNNWVAYPNKPYRSIAFKVKPKTTYSLSCSANVNVGNKGYFGIFPRGGYYATEDGGWNTSLHWGQSSGVTKTTFTTLDQEVYYMSLYFDSGFTQDNVTNFFTNRVVDIQIEEASAKTAYEPYKSNTTTFNQKDDKTIVLRSLPNGVCDTLNVETGEYVQRIGEVTKNNSTGFGLSKGGWENKSDVCTFEHFKPEGMKVQLANNKPTLNCDKVPSNTFSTQWNNSKGIESITQHNGGNIVLSITRDKLLTQDVNGLNTYLQSNPLTIQYELATPIVSTIDVQGFPYAYTNGHVQLTSGHSGQSLTPKVEYSLSANKTGQINSNTKRVSAHQKQLDDFEAMMLTSMVQSAYDKAILQFDYEMQMMSLGGE